MSHPSYTDTRATSQVIERAIARSISHNEIVYVDSSDAPAAGLVSQLSEECEGEALSTTFSVHEFWGRNVDGEDWRVHVRLPEPDDSDPPSSR